MRTLAAATLLACTFSAIGSVAQAQAPAQPAPIQDNSFLIEEAFNQEARVVQHVSAFFRSARGDWWYTFTQEWPLFGQRSQLSYTVPLLVGGFGDLLINYRLQLAGPGGPVAFSPRVSLIVPTGKWEAGRGGGTTGIQVNLPLSARLVPRVMTHWNAGLSFTPGARNTSGDQADAKTFLLGGSVIVEARHDFNLLLEVAWSRVESVNGPNSTGRDAELLISPGIRWAHTLKNGLQIVPGIGIPMLAGDALPGANRRGLFLYLSLEHAF